MKNSVVIYISDISNYSNIVQDIKPMLKRGYDVFVEKRPIFSMSGLSSFDYYLHIYKK